MLKFIKWTLIIICGSIFYVVTAVPLAMFAYSVKTNAGINMFSKTGFHAYAQCMREQAYKIQLNEKKAGKDTSSEE